MSGWSAYITSLTESCGIVKRAAIVGYPDASVWARTENSNEFKVSFLLIFCASYTKISGERGRIKATCDSI